MYNNDNDNNENNQCQKFPGITFFFGILIKINILLWKKNCTLYKHSDALQSWEGFARSTKEKALKWHLWSEATKINFKKLKT